MHPPEAQALLSVGLPSALQELGRDVEILQFYEVQ
jgi:hypothetical protein